MKLYLIICIANAVLIACNNNNAASEIPAAQMQQQPEVPSTMETNQAPAEGIAGYWKLVLEAYDENENKILDEAERKKGIKNKYTYRFNSDGSCQIQESFKGRYEVKTESGNKILYVYRNRVIGEEEKDPPPDVYRIISMSKNELVLLENIGNLTFWVFEKTN